MALSPPQVTLATNWLLNKLGPQSMDSPTIASQIIEDAILAATGQTVESGDEHLVRERLARLLVHESATPIIIDLQRPPYRPYYTNTDGDNLRILVSRAVKNADLTRELFAQHRHFDDSISEPALLQRYLQRPLQSDVKSVLMEFALEGHPAAQYIIQKLITHGSRSTLKAVREAAPHSREAVKILFETSSSPPMDGIDLHLIPIGHYRENKDYETLYRLASQGSKEAFNTLLDWGKLLHAEKVEDVVMSLDPLDFLRRLLSEGEEAARIFDGYQPLPSFLAHQRAQKIRTLFPSFEIPPGPTVIDDTMAMSTSREEFLDSLVPDVLSGVFNLDGTPFVGSLTELFRRLREARPEEVLWQRHSDQLESGIRFIRHGTSPFRKIEVGIQSTWEHVGLTPETKTFKASQIWTEVERGYDLFFPQLSGLGKLLGVPETADGIFAGLSHLLDLEISQTPQADGYLATRNQVEQSLEVRVNGFQRRLQIRVRSREPQPLPLALHPLWNAVIDLSEIQHKKFIAAEDRQLERREIDTQVTTARRQLLRHSASRLGLYRAAGRSTLAR